LPATAFRLRSWCSSPGPDPGARSLAARGSLRGQIRIGEDFEFSDDELDELLDEPA
jgi:hypothetical protein